MVKMPGFNIFFFFRALALKALDMRLSKTPAEPASRPDVLFDAEQNTPSNADLN